MRVYPRTSLDPRESGGSAFNALEEASREFRERCAATAPRGSSR